MKKEHISIFAILLALILLSIFFSSSQKNPFSYTGFQTLGTPLTPDQITETNNWVTSINNRAISYIYDVLEELDDHWTPHKDVTDTFWTKMKELVRDWGPCWALPNDLRPIDSDFLEEFFDKAEDAADTDGDTAWIIASHNLGDYNLNRVLEDYKARARTKIVNWCNLGQHATLRSFCSCTFNCAGGDNSGKVWNSLHYTCRDDCSSLSTTGLPANCAYTCNTALCTCEITPNACTPAPPSTPTAQPPGATTKPSPGTGGTGGGTPPTFNCNAATNPTYNNQFPNTCINNCNTATQICNKLTCHCDPKPEVKKGTTND